MKALWSVLIKLEWINSRKTDYVLNKALIYFFKLRLCKRKHLAIRLTISSGQPGEFKISTDPEKAVDMN